MASPSHLSSVPPLSPPVFSCSHCQMLSFSSYSITESGMCVKCSTMLALEARLSQLEERLRSFEHSSPVASRVSLAGAERSFASVASESLGPTSSPPFAAPEQPGKVGWVTVRRKRSLNKPAGHHHHSQHQAPSVHVSNKFAPLSSTPTEIDTLVIGSSIVRHVNLGQPSATVKCIPGARAGDIEGHLKLMAKNKRRCRRIVIHCGFNDARLKSSEVTKLNIASVCAFAQTMLDEVVFSGPLPNVRNDEMLSRMSSFHRWLSGWCPNNSVGFVDNWKPFWGKPGLVRRDGINPTREGAALLSSNIVKILASTH
ncbi:uncharacterized protein LOC142889609 [Nelusetta ayraudi]|uniref:uncharacterized protein LOC142889609 n=1 Tax=Nelusetta ayraudi TaxID=303726 RepID=UPI003F7062DE